MQTKENPGSTDELQTIPEKAEYRPETSKYNEEDEEEDLDEGYLKFLEETERHRVERDRLRKAEEDGGLKKSKKDLMRDIPQTEEEEEENIQSQADRISVDHERLKREMRSLYGSESLAVQSLD